MYVYRSLKLSCTLNMLNESKSKSSTNIIWANNFSTELAFTFSFIYSGFFDILESDVIHDSSVLPSIDQNIRQRKGKVKLNLKKKKDSTFKDLTKRY